MPKVQGSKSLASLKIVVEAWKQVPVDVQPRGTLPPSPVFFAKSAGMLENKGVGISRRAKECARV